MQIERHQRRSPISLANTAAFIDSVSDRIANLLNGRFQYVVLMLFTAVYLLITCYRASRKLFWFDELFTVYVSRLSDMGSIWKELTRAVDMNPPGFYAITLLSEAFLGETSLGVRLPSIIGFWVFCICLFRFVSRRASALS